MNQTIGVWFIHPNSFLTWRLGLTLMGLHHPLPLGQNAWATKLLELAGWLRVDRESPFVILVTNRSTYPFKILPSITDIPHRRIVSNKPIDARCHMGGFWNPNGGLIVNGKRLSKKEVSALKQTWSANHRRLLGPLKRWWEHIKFIVLALFCWILTSQIKWNK